jgi:hypothetical protein
MRVCAGALVAFGEDTVRDLACGGQGRGSDGKDTERTLRVWEGRGFNVGIMSVAKGVCGPLEGG